MATTTPFQGLTKPGYGDPEDVAVLNANFDLIDKIGTVLCTSGTRPNTGLFNGLQIYETDTKKTWRYDGTNWHIVEDIGGLTSFTTTLTNITIGNGSQSCGYKLTNRLMYVGLTLVFGSTSTIAASAATLTMPTLPTPYTAYNASSTRRRNLMGTLLYASGNGYNIVGLVNSSASGATINLQFANNANTSNRNSSITSALPEAGGSAGNLTGGSLWLEGWIDVS